MGEKKSGFIGGKIHPELRKRLNAITRRYGPGDTVLLEDALSALAAMVERERRYLRPMRMDWDEALAVAEEQAPYEEAKGPKKEPAKRRTA